MTPTQPTTPPRFASDNGTRGTLGTASATMKALTFKRYGKSPDIGFSHVATPELQPDEILVQVHAAAVNPIDNMVPAGTFRAC